jgi:hypothetical protein
MEHGDIGHSFGVLKKISNHPISHQFAIDMPLNSVIIHITDDNHFGINSLRDTFALRIPTGKGLIDFARVHDSAIM